MSVYQAMTLIIRALHVDDKAWMNDGMLTDCRMPTNCCQEIIFDFSEENLWVSYNSLVQRWINAEDGGQGFHLTDQPPSSRSH